MFDHLRRLARLRAELPPLRRGSLLHLYDEEQQTVFARTIDNWPVVITAFNNDTKPATFSFDVTATNLREGERLLDRLEVIKERPRVEQGRVSVTLPARSASILVAPRVVE